MMVACVTVLAGLLTMSIPLKAQTAVFINEIHYDNTGTDAGEAIEIAGPAGTDISGWTVVLYNGSNGAVYDTDPLNGAIPDMGGGFGVVVLNYPSNGIQNGSPDGIALVDANGLVVQFLSYEGVFTAVGGPADGLTSTDIGVSENGSGAVGASLQLTGSGTVYEDFTWAGEQPNTFGAVNSGQSFASSGTAILVINEIDYDQASTDTAEFIEIKNVGTGSADLSEYTLELVNGTGGGATVYQTIAFPASTLPAGDYFVVCGDAANVPNCDLDVSPDSNLVQNGAPDAVGLRHQGDLVDAVSYEGDSGAPYVEGSGAGLVDDPGIEAAGLSRLPDGIDTNINNVDLSLRCITPGEANSSGTSNCVTVINTNLVINEIDYDQPGTDTAEFVEIRNNGDASADLNGWTLTLINGNGTVVYATFDLSGHTLSAGDYFVICADTATVANCDLDVSPDTNLIQNGSPDAVALSFNGQLIDAVSYEGDTGAPYTEGSGIGLEDPGAAGSISRCPDGADTNQNNVDLVFTASSTPGAENGCVPPPPPEACGDPFTPIYVVQGSGGTSPLVSTEVAIEGIVVGDFQNNASLDNGNLNGFHVQDPAGDGNPATSDGIFVYAPLASDVSVGDVVRVRGSVSEFNGLTEISATQVWLCATGGSIAPTSLSLPVTSLDDFEAYEGMLVTFPQDLVISEYFNFDRFGEIVLSTERQYTPTAVEEPGAAANALAAEQTLARITLDDGRTTQNPDPAIHPNGNVFDLSNTFRGGDLVQGVTGVMDYSFGLYRIQPTQGANYTSLNPRTAPEAVGGSLKVVSANVLNYFTTIDTGAFICGPAQNQECRGADSQEELDRQRAKILAALSEMNADVAGLIEIENTNSEAVADLVAGLNDIFGAGAYAYIDTGTIGTDAIRVALIYKPASVTPVGSFAILDSSVDARFLDTKNRPALAQSFRQNSNGAVFTVAVNHLKSKGSDCNDVGDPDLFDGAGNCNLTRLAAAQALVDWLATDPTGSSDPDFLIIGDLNSYDKEDPIDAILAGSDDLMGTADDYVDLGAFFGGEFAYSYVFDGKLGYLDYALANTSLAAQVTGVTEWHNNADEPDILDYDTSFKLPAQAALYEPNAYRASDHDPVIVGLDLNAPPDATGAFASPDTLWPVNHKMTAVTILGVTDPDGDPVTITINAIYQDEPVNDTGDGSTAPDGGGIGTATALIRAERNGGGNGRYYHILFTATDSFGNTCEGVVRVSVPVNQGANGAAVDDGPLYDSTAMP